MVVVLHCILYLAHWCEGNKGIVRVDVFGASYSGAATCDSEASQ